MQAGGKVFGSIGHASDIGSDKIQLLFEPVVAAIKMIDAADDRFAVRSQSRE